MTSLILPDGYERPATRTYSEDEVCAAYEAGVMNSGTAHPAQWLIDYFSQGQSSAGVAVNYQTALGYAYVHAAVTLIAGDVSKLPLNVYDVASNGDRTVANSHPAQWLLNDEPNDLMDAQTFRETLQSHVLLWGNGYAAIERDSLNRPLRLIPLLPDRTCPQIAENGALYYETYETYTEYRRASDPLQLLPRDVLHIKGLGFDGLAGHSILTLARNTIGLGIAQEQHGATHFKNGARPSIVLTTEAKLDRETADMLLARWEKRHSGSDNSNRPALTDRGLQVKTLSMSNEDSQWIEGRKFSRVEVATWFNLPPHKLGDDSRLSYNSIEAENRAYLNQSLSRWLTKWESETKRKLLVERVRRARRQTVRHDTQDMLVADIETQVDLLVKLRTAGMINSNEARRRLGMESVEGLNDYDNPNTSSPSQTPQEPAEEPQEPLDAQARDGQRHLISNVMAYLIGIEKKDAVNAAGKPAFASWMDRYYADGGILQGKVEKAMDPILHAYGALVGECGWTATDLATQHVQQSRQALLTVATSCGSEDQLQQHVTEAVEQWPARADAWARQIVEGTTDV